MALFQRRVRKVVYDHYVRQRPVREMQNLKILCGNDGAHPIPVKMVHIGTVPNEHGPMVADIARAIRMLPKIRSIITMSLAGSTSSRLDARINEFIDGNVEIGIDCLQRVYNAC